MRARFALLGAVVILGLAGCGGSDKGHAGKAPDEPVAIKVSQSELGPIITDRYGRTLYAFTKDRAGTSVCADECIATWPALASRTKVAPGQGVDQSLLKNSQRSAGTFQATYGDWPLYYYAGDGKPGDLDGQGVDDEWFVVGADGKLVKQEA
ncbi:COG4315 family predicted lipoprotein [Actinomadura decatromicini]|uniref:Lipoprotein n=1 Tax=Actinomadura decatromicini TaxID=2604572 RepID=A0A5D3FZF9_9ACTN|nr:hypothetical protein [Actinomadura decatromicini]TYK53110.1 hypothetical protein FXF68_05115 [Actinomadura decatromicini]